MVRFLLTMKHKISIDIIFDEHVIQPIKGHGLDAKSGTLRSRDSKNSVEFHTGNCKVHTGVSDIKTLLTGVPAATILTSHNNKNNNNQFISIAICQPLQPTLGDVLMLMLLATRLSTQ